LRALNRGNKSSGGGKRERGLVRGEKDNLLRTSFTKDPFNGEGKEEKRILRITVMKVQGKTKNRLVEKGKGGRSTSFSISERHDLHRGGERGKTLLPHLAKGLQGGSSLTSGEEKRSSGDSTGTKRSTMFWPRIRKKVSKKKGSWFNAFLKKKKEKPKDTKGSRRIRGRGGGHSARRKECTWNNESQGKGRILVLKEASRRERTQRLLWTRGENSTEEKEEKRKKVQGGGIDIIDTIRGEEVSLYRS